jgi:hypothetical protein
MKRLWKERRSVMLAHLVGKPAWNRGRTYEEIYGKDKAQELIAKLSLVHLGKPRPDLIGKSCSAETREKLRIASTGREYSQESKDKIGQSKLGKTYDQIYRDPVAWQEMRSKTQKKLWDDPEYHNSQSSKMAHGRGKHPNRVEGKLGALLSALFPEEYRYTGNGSLVINGKVPDFVNVNGQKKIIELFGEYWHKPDEEMTRPLCFSPFGYQTLIVWSDELKDIPRLKEKLISFHEIS